MAHLTKRYGDREVVKDLSFVARPGRVTGFLGPNGSGKSTTMKVMLDLASADGGGATIGGVRYRDLGDPSGTVGALLESNAVHPGRSGSNHLRILADADGLPVERVDEVLHLVGLQDAGNRRVGAYSLGMRQRLGFAAALLGDPPVLILDEPANGLDPQGIHEPTADLSRCEHALADAISEHCTGVEVAHGDVDPNGDDTERHRAVVALWTPRRPNAVAKAGRVHSLDGDVGGDARLTAQVRHGGDERADGDRGGNDEEQRCGRRSCEAVG